MVSKSSFNNNHHNCMLMASTSVPCAIELEPKTLNPIQINHARELAVVLQKIEPQRALVEGLDQVSSIEEEMSQITQRNDENNANASTMVDGISKGMDYCKRKRQHNCLCTNILVDSPDEICHKEPVTAPF